MLLTRTPPEQWMYCGSGRILILSIAVAPVTSNKRFRISFFAATSSTSPYTLNVDKIEVNLYK